LIGAMFAMSGRWGRCTARPASTLASAMAAVMPAVHAEDRMKFEPVPEESARAVEKGREGTPPTPPSPPSTRTGMERSGSIVRIGSDIHIGADETVEGDVIALGGDVRIDGHVKGTVTSTGGDVTLGPTSKVDGDVACLGGELIEEPGSWVGGQRVTAAHG